MTAWAVRTSAGAALPSLTALADDVARPGRIAGDLTTVLGDLVAEVLKDRSCDLLLLATAKGDLPAWAEAILADPPALAGSPGAVAAALGRRHHCPAYAVSAACASGPIALAEAARAIRFGGLQRVVVVAGDRLAPFVETGFAGLQVVDPAGSRPFSCDRAGITLGETAAAILLEAGDGAGIFLQGWGQTLDAVHLTAPARDGAGLQRACVQAMGGARPGVIIAHGTGTRANDAAELAAYRAVLPDVPITGWKGGLGHSLGASGLTEVALALAALAAGGALPGVCALRHGEDAPLLSPGWHPGLGLPWLSTNAGFGGLNGAVLLGTAERPAQPAISVHLENRCTDEVLVGVRGAGRLPRPSAREAVGVADPQWGRLDAACRILVALGHHLGPWPAASGVVLVTDHGCLETDRRFEQARRQGIADHQAFAYTLPSAPVGEASIRLGLTGPGQVLVGASDAQARAAVAWLIQDGCPTVLLARIETGGAHESAWAERWSGLSGAANH